MDGDLTLNQLLLMFGGAGVLFIVSGIVFIVAGVSRNRRRTARAVGTIVDVRVDSDDVAAFHPVVRFMDDAGNVWEATSFIGRDRSQLSVGTEAVVSYDPSDPMRTAIVAEDRNVSLRFGGIFIAFGTLVLVLAAIMAWVVFNE